MMDSDCVHFLQWALPRMGLRWRGFRGLRRQVCRRIAARMRELGVADLQAYATHLEHHPEEWEALEALCSVTISRFYRDRQVFDCLSERVLPELARAAGPRGTVHVWSAGCASGEEPFTLALISQLRLAATFSDVDLRVLATDRDAHLLERAMRGCYRQSSLRELPPEWIERAFEPSADAWCLRAELRAVVNFQRADIRRALPPGPFQLILCRNLVFTYFDEQEQQRLLRELNARLAPNGYLVIGGHERLPAGSPGLRPLAGVSCIYAAASAE
jgi:chemotaxis protein methyltransferase CheR